MTTPLRRSAIEDAEHCLYRFDQLWNKGVVDQSDYSIRGIGYHVVKFHYVQRLWEKKLPSDDEEARIAFETGIAEAHTPAHLVHEVLELFRRQTQWFELDLNRFLLAEERQHTEDGTFAPDLVYASDVELEIVDDKTYYVGLTDAQLKTLFQARFYMKRAMERWPGFQRYRFTMNWVRLGYQTSVVFAVEDLATLEQEVNAVIASIKLATETGVWPAAAGPQCGYCMLECPLERAAANVQISIRSEEDAKAMAAAIYVADTRNKLRKKTLKRWAIANGKVPITVDPRGQLVFDHRPVQMVSYPAEKVIEVLHARQLPVLFNVSRTTLKPLFKLQGSLEQDLAMFVTSKTKYEFRAIKLLETEKPYDPEDEDAEEP